MASREEGGAHRTTPIACVSIASTQSRAETRGRARVDVRSDPAARWIKRARCAQAAPEASLVHAPETPLLTVWLDVTHVSHLEAVNSWEARTASSSSEFFELANAPPMKTEDLIIDLLVVEKCDELCETTIEVKVKKKRHSLPVSCDGRAPRAPLDTQSLSRRYRVYGGVRAASSSSNNGDPARFIHSLDFFAFSSRFIRAYLCSLVSPASAKRACWVCTPRARSRVSFLVLFRCECSESAFASSLYGPIRAGGAARDAEMETRTPALFARRRCERVFPARRSGRSPRIEGSQTEGKTPRR